MEEEGKTGKNTSTETDKFGLMELCLRELMKTDDHAQLKKMLASILEKACANPSHALCADAITLIECLEQLFDNNPVAFRDLLRHGYRQLDNTIFNYILFSQNYNPKELLPLMSIILKKIIRGWDAVPNSMPGTSALPSEPEEWKLHQDARECFRLMITAYRLGRTASSPLHDAIRKEINNIFKEHLEKGNGYWRIVPDALREWVISLDTPNYFAIMLAKARTRFLFADDVIAELQYLSDLGYYEASREEKDFLLSVAATIKKANLPAERNG